MEMILDLLERKNSFLEKFHTINEAELLNLESGDFHNLEAFYQCRENLLNIIGRMDSQLEELSKAMDNNIAADIRKRVIQLLDRKDDWVKKIVDQDLRIITCIEKEKTGIIDELKTVQKSRKLLDTYERSPGPTKTKLSEKA